MKAHSLVLQRVDALEQASSSPASAPGPSSPSRKEFTSLENSVSDVVTQVTLLVDEVDDLKAQLASPSPSPASPPASSPPVAAPAVAPTTAPGSNPAVGDSAEAPPAVAAAPKSGDPASSSSTGWNTTGKKKKKSAKGGPNPNRSSWLYVSNQRREDGKLSYKASAGNWHKHLANLLPAGNDLLRGVRKVINESDTRLTLACSSRAARAALLSDLSSTSSVKVFPHLLENEKAGRKLAQNIARSFGVQVVPRGDRCGFARFGAPNPANLSTYELNLPTEELQQVFSAACEALTKPRQRINQPRTAPQEHPMAPAPPHPPAYRMPAPSLPPPPGFPAPSYAQVVSSAGWP